MPGQWLSRCTTTAPRHVRPASHHCSGATRGTGHTSTVTATASPASEPMCRRTELRIRGRSRPGKQAH